VSVTLVCGPPCSGKSTYVTQHASPDALVVCWDTIAVELGSPREHAHPPRLYRAIAREYDRRIGQVRDAGEAWIIRTLADPSERRRWARRFNAELVVLCPPLDVLRERAQARPDPATTVRDIRRWLAANPRGMTTW